MKKKRYTKKEHVKRLQAMLKTGKLSSKCPGSTHEDLHFHWNPHRYKTIDPENYPFNPDKVCDLCRRFIGLNAGKGTVCTCPCSDLGTTEAIARTIEAIARFERTGR